VATHRIPLGGQAPFTERLSERRAPASLGKRRAPMIEQLESLAPTLRRFLPLLIVLAVSALTLAGADAFFRRRARRMGSAFPFSSQLAMLAVTAVAIVAAVITLPVSETTRGQLLTLLGIGLTGIIAFSSTTFVANAMAGLMLRAVGNFRAGDWVRVGDQFGRVTERGLFHTELQTEDRDLATLPNLHVVTNPVVVVRESGTIVSVRLSLGYDRHHADVEALLAEAARAAGLEDPFVHVVELGDFSVTYRVAGFLAEVKRLLTARSRLRSEVLDTLHGAGIEIVSPNFMNQRQLGAEARMVPEARAPSPAAPESPAPEELIFDKAEEKAVLEGLAEERKRRSEEIGALEEQAKTAGPQEKISAEPSGLRRALVDCINCSWLALPAGRSPARPRGVDPAAAPTRTPAPGSASWTSRSSPSPSSASTAPPPAPSRPGRA